MKVDNNKHKGYISEELSRYTPMLHYGRPIMRKILAEEEAQIRKKQQLLLEKQNTEARERRRTEKQEKQLKLEQKIKRKEKKRFEREWIFEEIKQAAGNALDAIGGATIYLTKCTGICLLSVAVIYGAGCAAAYTYTNYYPGIKSAVQQRIDESIKKESARVFYTGRLEQASNALYENPADHAAYAQAADAISGLGGLEGKMAKWGDLRSLHFTESRYAPAQALEDGIVLQRGYDSYFGGYVVASAEETLLDRYLSKKKQLFYSCLDKVYVRPFQKISKGDALGVLGKCRQADRFRKEYDTGGYFMFAELRVNGVPQNPFP